MNKNKVQKKKEAENRKACLEARNNNLALARLYLAFIPEGRSRVGESKYVTTLWGNRVLRGSEEHEYSDEVKRERFGAAVKVRI